MSYYTFFFRINELLDFKSSNYIWENKKEQRVFTFEKIKKNTMDGGFDIYKWSGLGLFYNPHIDL